MDKTAQKVWNQAHQQANSGRRTISIDPITRLEGHGKIEIFLNDQGNVDRAYLQIPELRGFEVFCQGRPSEDMPQLTSRICGVCPTAHHMAGAKTLDDLYGVECHPVGRKIRELVYNAFMFEDHALHVYVLGGPDFIVGPDAPKESRNILGVIGKVGLDVGKKVISMRRRVRDIINYAGGKVIHPVMGLPGGVAKGISASELPKLRETAKEALEFAKFTLQVFHDIVLKNDAYVKLITSDMFTHKTYYMGLVDKNNKVSFYDGELRVVTPEGKEYAKFPARDYLEHISEHVEPWSYIKFPFLKKVGWNGFVEGNSSGIFAVAPMARLNAAEGMSTPEAQKAYEEYFKVLGGKPVHHTLANHWARVVEMIQAAERMVELTNDPEITGKEFRTIPSKTPKIGVGVVEAPRGTLIHQYETDEKGLIRRANLIVATLNNSARIAMSVDKAAKGLIKEGKVNDGLLNMVEMAFRAYDPCFGCATHTLPGEMPMIVTLRDLKGAVIREIRRN
ncbi:MAG: F420-nonreducing hydrogenase [Elusimicrobia bacterium GWC2_51_8]|nr:MAG: F420-nonreducing hydrogenase [Elusimicrobia bacterium GWA2_51_34]OGR60725.1 MAG: F420-nonreducing hydrogenase [Elusimicrobia bacterium GWC2_51_8]OGR86617.1 MAG: F420-nonreducing hydrogenase [Elusimicrobia bacterium GWF2_52_66]HAF95064.1 Ni/Fe hydrogenase subunit alpha [Elusimicrobiota bacterium]HCE98465.1 Ni/Fe hydrogenase subunit alpha [Elusimicrobiota bacterium]